MKPHQDRECRLDAWLALTGNGPAPTGTVHLPMLSGSMAPAIPIEATLVITPASARDCRIGDVVVFTEQERLVAHRILLVLGFGDRRWFLEKGDANLKGRWARGKHVCGIVAEVIVPDTQVQGAGARSDPFNRSAAMSNLMAQLRWSILEWPRRLKRRFLDPESTVGNDDGRN